MLETLTADRFTSLTGNAFRVTSGEGQAQELLLAEVSHHQLASGGPEAARDPFSLIFTGPLDPFLPQGTYRFHHDELGTLDIFIVPIGPDGDRMQYEAVFS